MFKPFSASVALEVSSTLSSISLLLSYSYNSVFIFSCASLSFSFVISISFITVVRAFSFISSSPALFFYNFEILPSIGLSSATGSCMAF